MDTRRGFLRGAVILGVGAGLGGLRVGAAGAAGASVIDCATWGARPPSAAPTILGVRPDKILIHHTDTANRTAYGLAQAYQMCRAIQSYHMDTQGWSDSGQHFTVSREGYVLEGRRRSRETLDGGTAMVAAAHCPGQNDRAIGIENEGRYAGVAPPAALWDSLVAFTVRVCAAYGITASSIRGHRDFLSTDCPGDVLYARLPQLRAAVAAGLAGSGLRAWPTLRTGATGAAVRTVQHLLRQTGATVGVDGSFGAGTAAAVSAFQTARGLGADGVVGRVTWEALLAQLRQGATGEAVRGLQAALTAAGRPVGVDGSFGAGTLAAVRAFQSAEGIPADGIVGADTWHRLVT